MDASRFRRIGELFDVLVDLPAGSRAQRLRELCTDASLRAEVEALLRADARGDSFEAAAFDQRDALAMDDGEAHTPLPDQAFGDWRVIRELGRGGMGIVYLVERDGDRFLQRGALKLIKRGMDSEPIVARFLRERRVLAQLDHPGIARLLDGGMSADGRPFLVMDFVDGVRLSEHMRANPLPLADRLRIFLDVCDAVAHAHRQLVVHRDIKPANILVTREGIVKLLDFGIAKLLADGDGDGGTATRAGPFTPSYAAPEQREGGVVGTAADVYALGALLYELLTGTCATTGRHGGAEVDEVTAPSVRALAGVATAIPPRLLRGDLDIITRRALQHDPERRYPSVDALADDVRRHIEGRAIVARRASTGYRAYTFARRHRYLLSAASLVVVVSIAAAIFSRHQADAARSQAQRARTAQAFLAGVFAQASPDENNGRPFTAHELLERGERQAAQLANVSSQVEMLNLVAGLYWDIGDYDRAGTVATRAIGLGASAPPAVRARSRIVMARVASELRSFPEALRHAREARSLAMEAGEDGQAEALDARRTEIGALVASQDYRTAAPMLQGLLDDDRARFGEVSNEVADDYVLQGKILENSARGPEGIAAITRAVGILRALPTRSDTRLLDASSRLGVAQLHEQDLAAAEPTLRECVELATRLYGPDNIQTWTTRSNLIRVAELAGRFEEAVRERGALLDVERAALKDSNPGQLSSHAKFLAADLRELGRFGEAEAAFRESLQLADKANGKPGGSDSADALLHLGYTLQLQGRHTEAEVAMREAYAITSAHELARSQWLNDTRARLGNLLRVQGRNDEALVELRASAAALAPTEPDSTKPDPVRANVLAQLSLAELEAGDARKAESIASDALAMARRSFVPGNFRLGASLYALARAKLARGMADASLQLLDEALKVRSPPHPPGDPRVLEVQASRVATLAALGRDEEAAALRRSVDPLIDKLGAPYRPALRREMAIRN